jgi:hypothetical protein
MYFVHSAYDEKSGVSMATVRHLGQYFTGQSYRHPEEEYPSNYAGCQYAEIRATIKALKYERELAKHKADIAKEFVRKCEDRKEFQEEDSTTRAMYKELNTQIKKVNQLTDDINILLEDLQRRPIQRDIINKALHAKKKVKEESLS